MSFTHVPDVAGTEGHYGLRWQSAVSPQSIGSRELRYLAVAELLESGQPMTPWEVAAIMEKRGFTIRGSQPNKAVADALRWEVTKGRVVKPARGVFQSGRMPRSTKFWILGRARRHRELLSS